MQQYNIQLTSRCRTISTWRLSARPRYASTGVIDGPLVTTEPAALLPLLVALSSPADAALGADAAAPADSLVAPPLPPLGYGLLRFLRLRLLGFCGSFCGRS